MRVMHREPVPCLMSVDDMVRMVVSLLFFSVCNGCVAV